MLANRKALVYVALSQKTFLKTYQPPLVPLPNSET